MVYQSGGNRCTGLALRKLLYSKKMDFVMEAHSGLSAKVAAEAGFKALWASGLSISASLGLRDRNEASWTQVADVAEQIVQSAPGIPVLVDGDTGYGDFNSARRFVQELERCGVAGVSFEDKLFPKTNSFLDGVGGAQQDLADVEEFCLKLRACKEAQANPHFNIVARVEALIAGAGMEEALYRAEEYRKAGADAILIHSRQKDPSEIVEFCQAWDKKIPVIIVPTTYGIGVSKDEFYDAGASLSIWANHNMRASVNAMRETSRQLYKSEQVLPALEEKIAPVKDIFSMMNEDEMSQAELKYTPAAKPSIVFNDANTEAQSQKYHGCDFTPNKNINPDLIIDSLVKEGSNFFAGVPDSLMKTLCESISSSQELTNVIAANEGTAVALATGHYLATGDVPVVYMQNSGLGNAVNPLLSLVHEDVYSIPMLVVIGWRGELFDEPQHMVQGGCMEKMIGDMGFESIVLPVSTDVAAADAVRAAHEQALHNNAPVFIIVRKNTFGGSKRVGTCEKKDLNGPFSSTGMSRLDAIKSIDALCPKKEWVRVCTTGKASRELYETTANDKSGDLEDMLVVGSMGHACSIAQGVALGMEHKDIRSKSVLCIDGDGSVIMHMGSLSQAGQLKTPLLHIVLNNGTHESVGMEASAAADPDSMSLTGVASSCGYEAVQIANSFEDIAKFVADFNQTEVRGPWLLEVRIGISDPGSPLLRPKETPKQRKEGVMQHIAN